MISYIELGRLVTESEHSRNIATRRRQKLHTIKEAKHYIKAWTTKENVRTGNKCMLERAIDELTQAITIYHTREVTL